MSREPSSPAHRYADALRRSGAVEPPKPAAKKKPGTPLWKRIKVEGAKKKPPPPKVQPVATPVAKPRQRFEHGRLSAELRALLAEFREINAIERGYRRRPR